MGTLIPLNKVDFYSPAVFLIEVKGKVDKSLSDTLGALKINYHTIDGKTTVSRLKGMVLDQTALMGILNALYEMRLPIVSLKIISEN